MPDFCSCGARLPEDALFCHKCGKPQRPDLIKAPDPEPEAPVEDEPTAARRAYLEHAGIPERIDFSDPLAVRISLFVGCVTGVLVSFLPLACMVWLVGAGFFAVSLYGRRKHLRLPRRQALQLGWLTGLFTFTITLVFFVINMFVLINAGKLSEEQRKAMEEYPIFGDRAAESMEILKDPTMMAVSLTFSILLIFVICTVLPVAGAAIAARVQELD